MFCSGHLNYVSVLEDGATYFKLLALFIIPEDSEDLRRSLDRDDRLEECGDRDSKLGSQARRLPHEWRTLTARFVWFPSSPA